MVLIQLTNVKLSPSFNCYVLDCCLWMAVAVVLVTRLRRVQISWKDERVIYNVGIQNFLSCHLDVWLKVQISQVT
jgi:hypothetical protein